MNRDTEAVTSPRPGRARSGFGLRLPIRVCAIALCAILYVGPGVAAENPFATVVSVGDEVITGYEVEQYARIQAFEQGREISEEVRQIAIEQLIDSRLISQAATAVGIGVEDEEVEQRIAVLAERTALESDEWISAYNEAGADKESLFAAVRTQILWQRLLNARFGRQAREGLDAESLERQLIEYERNQIVVHRLFRISLGILQASEMNRASELVSSIRNRLTQGEEFAEIATLVSRSEDAATGGEIGWRTDSDLSPELGEIVNSLPVGGVSDPIVAGDGEVVLIHVDNREILLPDGVDLFRHDLVRIMLPYGEGVEESSRSAYLAVLKDVRETGGECARETFEDERLVREKFEGLHVAEIAPDLRTRVLRLQVGESIAIVVGQDAVWYAVLCGRTGGIREDALEDITNAIMNARLAERLGQIGDAYLEELRMNATIERKDL